MNDVKFGNILEDACRLAGRDPNNAGIPVGWKAMAAMTINAGVRDLAAEKFPMLQRVEYRRYRPSWKEGSVYAAGHEVWHGEDYWRANEATDAEPGTSDAWRKLEDGEVAAFIEFSQPWENTVIDPGGVDYTAFAYLADPRYNPQASVIENCALSSLGVLIPAPAPKGVWVKFVPEFPAISFAPHVDGQVYSGGEVRYVDVEKECYQAICATEEAPSAESSAWQPVRIRREFQLYLTRLLAVDFLTEDQGKWQTRQAADRELAILHERYIQGVGSRRARVGRFG